MSLLTTLTNRLIQDQDLPFVNFMHLALYDPLEGYYSSDLTKLGNEGDFITAPELSPLFGKSLANQCQQIMSQLTHPDLFEYGAGSGRLCVDILTHLESLNSLPQFYYILEVSANLQQRQRDLIHQVIPHLAHKVIWLNQPPKTPFNGVILANEVLDAMPVHRFLLSEQGILESYIGLNEHHELIEQFKPSQDQRLIDYIQTNLPMITAPYLSEANLYLDGWMRSNYDMLNQGAMILIDYGFPRHEYYHSDRNQGTLMCHYQHQAHTNPLHRPGEEDLTAHVDFTHVAEAGHQAGFHVAGYTNQASFLLGNGLISFIPDEANEPKQYQAKQAIKQLTHPSEMGELFKVIALTKNLDIDLHGFLLHDKRVSL